MAHAESRPAYGGRARVPISETPVVDPLAPTDGARQIARLVFDTLFACPNGAPEPRLAVELTGGDPLRPLLKLRAGVTLHDGRALAATDVAASLQRATHSSSPTAFVLAPLVTARAIAVDTVELQLSRPTPELPTLLCAPATAIAVPSSKGTHALIGTGPFFVADFDARHVVLRAFPAHFAGRPYLDEVVTMVVASRTEEAGGYELGLLEESRQGAAAFAGGHPKHPAVVVDSEPGATTFVAVGAALSPAARAVVAPALAALDRKRLAKSTTPNLVLVDEGPRLRSRPSRYAPGRQAAHGDQGRFEDAPLDDRLLAELARVGIDATIERAASRDFVERLAAGRFELALATVATPAADPALALHAVAAALDPAGARTRFGHGAPAKIDAVIVGRRAARASGTTRRADRCPARRNSRLGQRVLRATAEAEINEAVLQIGAGLRGRAPAHGGRARLGPRRPRAAIPRRLRARARRSGGRRRVGVLRQTLEVNEVAATRHLARVDDPLVGPLLLELGKGELDENASVELGHRTSEEMQALGLDLLTLVDAHGDVLAAGHFPGRAGERADPSPAQSAAALHMERVVQSGSVRVVLAIVATQTVEAHFADGIAPRIRVSSGRELGSTFLAQLHQRAQLFLPDGRVLSTLTGTWPPKRTIRAASCG